MPRKAEVEITKPDLEAQIAAGRTVSEAADVLGVPRGSVSYHCKKFRLSFKGNGGQARVNRETAATRPLTQKRLIMDRIVTVGQRILRLEDLRRRLYDALEQEEGLEQ